MIQRRDLIKAAAIGVPGYLACGGWPRLGQASADPPADVKAFTHPGILHNPQEIDFIKQQIAAKQSPWLRAWERLESSGERYLRQDPEPRREVVRGPSNRPDIGSSEFSHDGTAAYTTALAWSLTGQRQYAQQAIAILNAWSRTLEKVSGHDTRLLIGMVGVKFVNAAELIRHTYDGWKNNDQSQFEAMLRERFYEPIKDFYPTANGNWDASMIQTMLAMGVYLDDRAMFDRAADYFRKGEGNGAITKYFNDFGQCQETGRDQAHTQMGLGYLGCACEIAWKQGVDLYGEADSRLALGFEYTAKYNLGEDVRYEPYRSVEGRYHYKTISDDSRGRFAPIYRRVVYHYHHRKGMPMPYSLRAIERVDQRRRRREQTHHFNWTDLMFVKPPQEAG